MDALKGSESAKKLESYEVTAGWKGDSGTVEYSPSPLRGCTDV
jgi:hypothetical protein